MSDTPDWTVWQRGEWRRWRRSREDALRSPYGWLSVTALHWLEDQPSPIEGFPGLWSGDADEVRVELEDSDGVVRDGVPVSGSLVFELEEDASDDSLLHDGVVAEVGIRSGHPMVRLRDPDAPARTSFTGVPTFDYDPSWVVAGTFVRYPREIVREIATAHPEVRQQMVIWGEFCCTIGEHDVTLLVSGRQGSGSVVFSDPTNGIDTADWRSVPLGEVDPAGGSSLDFNLSTNFPSAFIPGRATCPRPVPENWLPFPVTAGEKRALADGGDRSGDVRS